ncbi:MAG: DMT family transporter [Actinobacteria bacterium]|nr:DMT family transporter [Actinomycetota bacterium]MCA1720741.1 DMT family transporter [Actinomycetota bacterium]
MLRVRAAAPAVFVLLWSTGFVGARYGLPYADPFRFLAIRLAIAAAVLAAAAVALRMPISRAQAGRAAVSGLLLHAAYLGGVFWAISRGTPAGISSVVVSLQPVTVAALASRLLGERLVRRQWVGLVLGVLGVCLVLGPALRGSLPVVGALACLVALAGGTAGTLWQKRHGDGIPLLAGTGVQYAAATAALLVLSLLVEPGRVEWTGRFIGALVWLVVGLSIGAVLLLLALLRAGTASSVSSLFYLVPPATAVESYLLFDERLAPLSLVGIVVAALGVWLVVSARRTAP